MQILLTPVEEPERKKGFNTTFSFALSNLALSIEEGSGLVEPSFCDAILLQFIEDYEEEFHLTPNDLPALKKFIVFELNRVSNGYNNEL